MIVRFTLSLLETAKMKGTCNCSTITVRVNDPDLFGDKRRGMFAIALIVGKHLVQVHRANSNPKQAC